MALALAASGALAQAPSEDAGAPDAAASQDAGAPDAAPATGPEEDTPGEPQGAPAEESEGAPAAHPPAQRELGDDAKTHLRLGHAYYESGRFADAASEFDQAYEASKAPRVLYDLFLAYRDAGQIGKAIDALEKYLKMVPQAPNHAALESRLTTLERLQQQRAVEGGAEGASGEAGGTEQVEGKGAESETTGPALPKGASDLEPADERIAQEAGGEPAARTGWALPWTVMGVGAALVAGGTATGIMALKLQKDLESRCPGKVCEPGTFESDVDRGRRLATSTDVLLGTGLIAVGAGVAILFLLGPDLTERAPTRPSSPTASVGCGADGCMGQVSVRF